MMFGPQIYLILALVAALPAQYGYMKLKQYRIETAAYAAGKRVGAETVAAATTARATEIAAAVTEAEASVAPVDPAKAAIVALCQKQASCRERKRP